MDWFKKSSERRTAINILLFALFSLSVALVMNFSWAKFPVDLQVGGIAAYDIRADRDYEITDQEATDKLRREKLDGVLPVFDWDKRLSVGLKVVSDRSVLESWLQKGILLNAKKGDSKSVAEPIFFNDWPHVYTVEEAKGRVPAEKRKYVHPNLILNTPETELRIQKVMLEIKEVVIKVQRGESILRAGDRVEPWHVKVIAGIQAERSRRQIGVRWIGTFGFAMILLSLLYAAGGILVKKSSPKRVDYLFQASLLLILLCSQRLLLFFSGSVRELLPFDVPLESFYVAMPIAAGAIIVRLVLSSPIAFLFAVGSSCLASILLENSLFYGLYFLAGGLAAVWLSGPVKSRSNLLKVGLELGGINVVTLLMLNFANSTSPSGIYLWKDLPTLLGFALVGGVASAVLALTLLPIFESVFNYLSPIKLLEFGSLNHPILREMIVQAPGTYHHSHMVGTLAESACEAIGADALFARVASYFHDIGKLRKPPYFIENQPIGEDRHSTLAPSMSALIISAHVKEGMELAKQYKLPQRIIDIIPQHQGTKLITYFFSKAKEAEKRDMHVVDERDYRYPGPKPQTREAGVILLADTVEASTRSLKERTPSRLEEVVRNMINKNFIDGQLDECDLTLQDLQVIGKCFVRILMGIYHQRVEYPTVPSKEGPTGSVPPHVDKYTQSSPLGESSLREVKTGPSGTIPRIGKK